MLQFTIESIKDYRHRKHLTKSLFWSFSDTPRKTLKWKPGFIVNIHDTNDFDWVKIGTQRAAIYRYLNDNMISYCLYVFETSELKLLMKNQEDIVMLKLASG